MLYINDVLLEQLYNLDLKFKENWPKLGRIIKRPFLGTVIKVLLGTVKSNSESTVANEEPKIPKSRNLKVD